MIVLNSWTGGKLSKVNYQRSFVQTSLSPYNINLVLSYLMSPCLVPRLLHCCNFQLTDNTFYSRRFIHVVHVGFSCLPFHNSPVCSPTDQCWPIGRDISMPLFSRKKLQKMRPSTFNNLKDLRVKIVQGGKGWGSRRLAADKAQADTLQPPPPPFLGGTSVMFFQESPYYLHVNILLEG